MFLLLLIISAAILGTAFVRLMRIEETGFESYAIRMLCGFCLCAVLIIATGSRSLQLSLFALFIAVGLGFAYDLISQRLRRERSEPVFHGDERLRPFDYVCLSAIAIPLVLAGLAAFAPVTSWDAGVAHLALPSDYVREGRIMLFEGNAYSAYPHLMHSLYAFAFLHGGEKGAALINWLFALCSCAVVYGLGRRMDKENGGGHRCGLIAAAILATAPIFLDQAGTVSIDLAFVAVAMAALLCLVAWFQEKSFGWLILSAFFAGSSCGIRHTGYLICVLLTVAVLFGNSEKRLRFVSCFVGVGILAALPWLLRSALLVGNPFYPFFLGLFSSPIPDADITGFGKHGTVSNISFKSFLMFPWNVIMRPQWFDGWSKSPGGLILVLGVPGFFLGGKRVRWLVAFSVAGGICFFFFQQLVRYLLPFAVPMMVVAAIAAVKLDWMRRSIAAVLILSFAYGIGLHAAAMHFKLPVVFGFEEREDYLARRVERYKAFEWMNAVNKKGYSVFTFDMRSYYLDGPTYQNIFALPELVEKGTVEKMEWMLERNIKYLFVPFVDLDGKPSLLSELGAFKLIESLQWDTDRIFLIKRLEMSGRGGEGEEAVEIYEVFYDGLGGE